MIALHLELTLTAPALFLRHGKDRNTVDTWRRIPGAAIAGALASRWTRQHKNLQNDLTLHSDFRRLFLSGDVCYLHGYPADDQGQRLLPAPLSLVQRKGDDDEDGTTLWDRAAEDPAEPNTTGAELGFVALSGDTIRWHQPKVRVHLHHTRQRDKGVPDDRNAKSIFHYRALSPGQRFVAVITAEQQADVKLLRALLQEGPLWLGRSRGTEYGGCATVKVLKEELDFEEVAFADEDRGESLVVTLLSEYVGAPGGGGSSGELLRTLQEDLSRALGGAALGELDRSRSHVRFQALGGFIGSWHMPRPQVLALQAGSVLVFSQAQAQARVLTLGERRAEGFGRVALGWQGHESKYRRQKISFSEAQERPIPAAALPLLRQMAQEWLRQQLPACLGSLQTERLPAPSLLGRLRADLQRTLKQPRTKAQLERCRVRLGKWLTLEEWLNGLQGKDGNDRVLGLLRPELKKVPPLLQKLSPADWQIEAGKLRDALQDALLAELRRRAQRQEVAP